MPDLFLRPWVCGTVSSNAIITGKGFPNSVVCCHLEELLLTADKTRSSSRAYMSQWHYVQSPYLAYARQIYIQTLHYFRQIVCRHPYFRCVMNANCLPYLLHTSVSSRTVCKLENAKFKAGIHLQSVRCSTVVSVTGWPNNVITSQFGQYPGRRSTGESGQDTRGEWHCGCLCGCASHFSSHVSLTINSISSDVYSHVHRCTTSGKVSLERSGKT